MKRTAPKSSAEQARGASDNLFNLKESDMLEESVIYQDILQKGKQRGLQEGERKPAFANVAARPVIVPP